MPPPVRPAPLRSPLTDRASAVVLGPRRLLAQSSSQVDFGRRRFRLGAARPQLEAAGQAFLIGYNAVVGADRLEDAVSVVTALPPAGRGFAAEGAGMATAVLDLVTLSRGRRTDRLLTLVGDPYGYLVHVGVGWAHARLRLRPSVGVRVGEPLLRWLAWDGYGFHRAFFAADRTIGAGRRPAGVVGPRGRIHDQGVGRAMWFHECAEPDAVLDRLAEFAAARRPDLWSGVGLAAAYAGGADEASLGRLADAAGPLWPHLAQGVAFACEAHRRSGHVPRHTETAASALTGGSAERAANWARAARHDLGPVAGSAEDYQAWRAGVRAGAIGAGR